MFAALSPPLLGVLLRHGLPPVDPAVPFHPPVLNPWDVKRWACPVLHLLQVNALVRGGWLRGCLRLRDCCAQLCARFPSLHEPPTPLLHPCPARSALTGHTCRC